MTSVGVMASAVVPPAAGNDVLLEPFNNFTFAPWTVGAGSIVTGRTGTAAQILGNFTDTIKYTIPSGSQSDTVTIGFAFRAASLGGETNILEINSDADATQHNRLTWNSSGALLFYRSFSGLLTTASGLIVANTWTYIELQVKLHDTTGTYDLHVNGVSVGAASNVDTRNGGTKTVYDTVKVNLGAIARLYDDMYITTGAGAPFKGNITIP